MLLKQKNRERVGLKNKKGQELIKGLWVIQSSPDYFQGATHGTDPKPLTDCAGQMKEAIKKMKWSLLAITKNSAEHLTALFTEKLKRTFEQKLN